MATAHEQVCLPEPRSWTLAGETVAPQSTVIDWQGARCPRVQAYAVKWLSDLELGQVSFVITAIDDAVPQIDMDESYSVVRDGDSLIVSAATTWGGLRAVATLYQLAMGGALVAHCAVDDRPRFPWRGLLIDVARHFIPLSVLQRVIDGMGLLKLNVLHLHLSDDQGFRFASEHYPKLASAEHYSAVELQALVTYAAAAGVRVVPELDMPGHVTSWLTAYPEWGYQQVAPTERFGVHKACLDVSNPQVLQAIDDLFAELVAIFPDQFLHIGGDEVHPSWWREDQKMHAHATDAGLVGPEAIQNSFNHKVVEMVKAKGRRVVGWDEVLNPQMPSMVVQNWRGASTRDRALNRGLDCIVSAPFYLDLHYPADLHYAYDPEMDQAQWFALEDAHQIDPRLKHVAQGIGWTLQWREGAEDLRTGKSNGQADGGRVLGGEACLWSELVDPGVLEVRLWSRLPAVAERLWSPAETVATTSFYRRLNSLLSMPPFELRQAQSTRLQTLGLKLEQAELVQLLEPVKWYGRLLGEVALRARIEGNEMPQARPYGVNTPLNRVVDYISPESLSARALAEQSWQQWQASAERWSEFKLEEFPEDTRTALSALQQLGHLILAHGDDAQQLDPERIGELYGPHNGEYMLAVVPALLEWLQQQDVRAGKSG